MKKMMILSAATLFLIGCSENEEVAEGTGEAAEEQSAVQQETNAEENEVNEGENADNNGMEEEEKDIEKLEREFDEGFHDKHNTSELHEAVQEDYERYVEVNREMKEENPDQNRPIYLMEEESQKIFEGEHNLLEYVFVGMPEDKDETTHMIYTYEVNYHDGEYSVLDRETEIVWE